MKTVHLRQHVVAAIFWIAIPLANSHQLSVGQITPQLPSNI